MRRSRIPIHSAAKLYIQRSLARGGLSQFLLPVIVTFAVLAAISVVLFSLLSGGSIGDKIAFRDGVSFSDLGIFGVAFYSLFTTGGVDQLDWSLGWLVTLVGIFLSALLISIFTNYLKELAEDYKDGRSDFSFIDHVAFFGYDATVPDLLLQMFSGKYAECRFLIMTSSDVRQAYAGLAAVLTPEQFDRVTVLRGDVASPGGIARMQVWRAQEIHVFGDAGGDTEVLQCLKGIAAALPEGAGRVPCYAMLRHRSASAVFQFADIGKEIGAKLAFFPFNRSEMWAHKLFVNLSVVPDADGYLPLEGAVGISPESLDHVHLVIVGMTEIGIALGLEAGLLGHFPNVVAHPECRTRISFVAPGLALRMHELQGRYRSMFELCRWRYTDGAGLPSAAWKLPEGTGHLGGDFMDFEWEFIDAEVTSPVVRKYLTDCALDEHTRLTLAFCGDDPSASVDAALSMPRELYEAAVQIPVYQPQGSSIIDALASGVTVTASPYRKLRAFGMGSKSYDLSLIDELIRASSVLDKDPDKTALEIIESKSDAAKMWSNIYNACHIWSKLRSVQASDSKGITGEYRDVLARTEHNRWNAEQLLMQFRHLTPQEQAWVLEDDTLGRKGTLKRELMAHLDICSWDRLDEIDHEVLAYDYNMVDSISRL